MRDESEGHGLDRRHFLFAAGLAAVLPAAARADGGAVSDATSGETAAAFGEFVSSLGELADAYASDTRGVLTVQDKAEAHRHLLHILQQALLVELESTPSHPRFVRQVSPNLKTNGDNPDAIYHLAMIEPGRRYRIRSNQAGAVYSSITVQSGRGKGRYAGRIASVINDAQYEIGSDGGFEIELGGPQRRKNWLALPDDAAQIMTRHYFERTTSAAADPTLHVPMSIECLDDVAPPPAPDDASIAAAIRRATTYVRTRTTGFRPPARAPGWVSTVPNVFNAPQQPGSLAYAAADAAYTMAPYLLGPDEALVVTGRFPDCRFANVVLWNRFMQSYDYTTRSISKNRAQTVLEEDGSFRIVIAHRDPGVPNWLDTEGRPQGSVYWRFMLPEGEIETPKAEKVSFSSL